MDRQARHSADKSKWLSRSLERELSKCTFSPNIAKPKLSKQISNVINTTKAAELRRTASKDRIKQLEERIAKGKNEEELERVPIVENVRYTINDENDEMLIKSRKPKLVIPTASEAKQVIKPGMVSVSLYDPDKKRKVIVAKKPARSGKPSQVEEMTVQQLATMKKVTQKKSKQDRIGKIYSTQESSSYNTENQNILGDLSNVN